MAAPVFAEITRYALREFRVPPPPAAAATAAPPATAAGAQSVGEADLPVTSIPSPQSIPAPGPTPTTTP